MYLCIENENTTENNMHTDDLKNGLESMFIYYFGQDCV